MDQPDSVPFRNPMNNLHHLQPDPVLRALVEGVNADDDAFVGVTLMVGGTTVSGKLIGYRQFLGIFGDLWKGSGGEGIEVAQVFYERGLEDAVNSIEPDTTVQPMDEPRYIHLKDATVRGGGGVYVHKLLWRGRLSAVDGWFLGVPQNSLAKTIGAGRGWLGGLRRQN